VTSEPPSVFVVLFLAFVVLVSWWINWVLGGTFTIAVAWWGYRRIYLKLPGMSRKAMLVITLVLTVTMLIFSLLFLIWISVKSVTLIPQSQSPDVERVSPTRAP
jgi:hypothetical protein